MAFVSRDPFAREEIHRRAVQCAGKGSECQWCGRVRESRKGVRTLYEYRVESDGGRVSVIEGLFCSIGCMRAFHS